MPLNVSSVYEASPSAITSRRSFAGALKDIFAPAWEAQVHAADKLAGKIAKKRGTIPLGGIRTLTMVTTAFPASVAQALAEDDTLPTPRNSEHINPVIVSRSMYSRLRFTLEVEKASAAGDKAAWLQARRSELEMAMKEFDIQFERKLFLGPLDILGTIKSESSGVATMYGRNTRTSASADRHKHGVRYLRKGMEVNTIAHSGNAVVQLGAHYSDRNTSANRRFVNSTPNYKTVTDPTVTVADVAGTAGFSNDTTGANEARNDGDAIIAYNSRLKTGITMGTDAANFDTALFSPNGLLGLVADTNIKDYVYQLSRATYPQLEAYTSSNSGSLRAMSEDLIVLACDNVADLGTGNQPDMLLAGRPLRREYIKETQGQRQFEPVQQKKGYKQLAFQAGDVSLPFETNFQHPDGKMHLLDTSSFGWMSLAEMQQVGDDRFVADKAQSEVVFVKMGNEVCENIPNNALIDDIDFDAYAINT